jgi:hypothetical protein
MRGILLLIRRVRHLKLVQTSLQNRRVDELIQIRTLVLLAKRMTLHLLTVARWRLEGEIVSAKRRVW